MKKLYSRKLAVALALASIFGVKPASGLNNLAKVAIPVALVGLVGGGGLLIHHLLKKESGGYGADGRIPAEYAYAELLRLQNVGSPEKRLEEFFAMQNSVDGWSKKDRAFYYFIGGGAARVLYPYNKSNLAFYAAQVNTDPNPTSVGWQHLRETEGSTLLATQESARQMHEKYPMPHSMEEARNYLII